MAMILSSSVGLLGQKLAPLIEEEVVMLFGVKGELVKLQGKLQLIQSVLEDAEKKAFHDAAIRRWTDRLKDVMYDADDVIDEFRTKQLLQLVGA
ncbi:putative disease resistance protein RGA1 [Iris pallida]|uniref:Disease resistance protein RGA1 n=1 Tax=Iris pallida TaxID=29817 RepID=A0AAX6EF81_IRIPA|nr:putative disease resistance protein RGA1 [Iris pallida]